MQYLKRLIAVFSCLLVVSMIFVQCKQENKDGFTVTINYVNADKFPQSNFPVILQQILYGANERSMMIDTARITGKEGKIVLKGNIKENALFQVAIEQGPHILVVNDSKDIKIKLDFAGGYDNYYSITGSDASVQLHDFIVNYGRKSMDIRSNTFKLDSMHKVKASDSLMQVEFAKRETAIKGLNDYTASVLNDSKSGYVSLFVLGMASQSFEQEKFETALNAAIKKFPGNNGLTQLKTSFEKQMQGAEESASAVSWTGKPAPVFSLPDASGKQISIADFKGKYVLVDFWASWCGPCRHENPVVVEVYNKYKEKNFTVLGVSLDKDKDAWLKAIADDHLTWTHISDLKQWKSKAVEVFRFEGIPFNILVDPKGNIIAENLRGDALNKKLGEVLK